MLAYNFKRRLYYDSFIGLGELVDFGRFSVDFELSYTVASCTWCFEPPKVGIPQLQPIWCFETPQSRRQLSVIQNTSIVF
jgi:hypothetical protein